MYSTLEKILARPPSLLEKFRVIGSAPAPEDWNSGPEFATRQIGCICGSEHLQVATLQRSETKGIFRKKQIITYIPPVYVSCPACSRRELLFDAAVHGWDGQAPGERQASDSSNLVPYKDSSGSVLVNYSYQGIENYEDLLEDGTENPQDYFDTFTVYFREKDARALEQVISCECA